ncbi:MAG TPA: class I SAM-dependent methyltransferase [Chloroflexota bacterium]|nr:class I SAM-dependent methyltransferase [Chloroflexota bacterium]
MNVERGTLNADDRWRSDEHAREWLAKHGGPEADGSEQFHLIARLLPHPTESALRVADVGAGHGTLTAVILDTFPNAQATCLDINPTMIAAGQERLARFAGRFRYVQSDLTEPGWPAEASGPFDAVVSSRAIHHLMDARKRELFGEILARLRSGGWLLNFDYVRAPSDALREIYIRVQEPASGSPADHHQGDHSHTSPLLGQLQMLESIGFVDVDCFWKQFGSAIFGGRKP